MKKVIYPGSFDPITKGHMNIIEQASTLFDKVYVAVMVNAKKNNSLFTIEERISMIKDIYENNPKVEVITGLVTSDLALEYGCVAIVKGLRSVTDFEYEIGMAHINKDISDGKINTISLFADKEYEYLSSSVVRELAYLNKDTEPYVAKEVAHQLVKKLGR
ncbi:MAG: pantetheine-phosphate adenylyltransferase [Bacilli bacterium]